MNKSEVKNPNYPIGALILIVVSFLLGLLDMILLQEKIHDLFGFNSAMSMFTALIIATIANFTAWQWGLKNGEIMAEKSINKESKGLFLGWVIIGLIYAGIRIVFIFNHTIMGIPKALGYSDIMAEVLQIAILATSYIGTGLLISSSARKIHDAECVEYRRVKKEFDRIHRDISGEIAEIKADLKILGKFQNNYISLKQQRNRKEQELKRAEKRTLSDIAGRVLEKHPEIPPSLVRKGIDEILSEKERDRLGA